MKTAEKILAFITVIVFVTLSVGMLVAGNSDFGGDEPEMTTKVGNTFASWGLILSCSVLVIWLIVVIKKGFEALPQGKLNPTLFHSYCFLVFPFLASVLLKVTVETIVYLDYLSDAVFSVYSHLFWSIMSFFGSPAFWVTFGLAEIIMSGIVLFGKKSAKIPNLN